MAVVAIYPAYGERNALLQPTWPTVGMFVSFLPVIAFESLLWLGSLLMAFGIIRALVGR